MLVGDITVARSPRTNGYVWSITFNDVIRNNGNQPPFVTTVGTLSSGVNNKTKPNNCGITIMLLDN